MMTREEAEKALRDSAFNEKIQELKTAFEDQRKATNALFEGFLASLRKEKIKVEVNGVKEVNELKTAINNLHIPEEVTVNQKITHTTDKVSHKFLWGHFVFCFIVLAVAITFAVNAYYSNKEKTAQEVAKAIRINTIETEQRTLKNIYMNVPPNTQKYLKNNFPEFKNISEKNKGL